MPRKHVGRRGIDGLLLNSAMDGGEWSGSRSGRFTSEERTPATHWLWDWVLPRADLGDWTTWRTEKYLTLRGVLCLPKRRPEFEPRSGHVGFVVDKVAVGQVFLRVRRFPLPILIPTALYSSSSIIRGWYSRPISGTHRLPSGLTLHYTKKLNRELPLRGIEHRLPSHYTDWATSAIKIEKVATPNLATLQGR
jgi:hypothetical protein